MHRLEILQIYVPLANIENHIRADTDNWSNVYVKNCWYRYLKNTADKPISDC